MRDIFRDIQMQQHEMREGLELYTTNHQFLPLSNQSATYKALANSIYSVSGINDGPSRRRLYSGDRNATVSARTPASHWLDELDEMDIQDVVFSLNRYRRIVESARVD